MAAASRVSALEEMAAHEDSSVLLAPPVRASGADAESINWIGTVCPPAITRPATRAALMRGSAVPMKKTRTKYPVAAARRTKSTLASVERTVSKAIRLPRVRSSSRRASVHRAASKTASRELQSPNRSRAISSGFRYSTPSLQRSARSLSVTVVLPAPFGPARRAKRGTIDARHAGRSLDDLRKAATSLPLLLCDPRWFGGVLLLHGKLSDAVLQLDARDHALFFQRHEIDCGLRQLVADLFHLLLEVSHQ